ncbi:MAG TPA: ATP-binding protein [Syntrophales bacterium]
MIARELYRNIWQELASDKEMVFLAGPRQTGKTTLGGIIAEGFANSLYFNWDIPEQRSRLLQNPSFFEEVDRKDASPPLIIFDEIHKYRDWKNYLKGVYDGSRSGYRFLVSGSGRLDIYQKGGDSLAGRYLLFHLFPFTLAELGNVRRSYEEFMLEPFAVSSASGSELREIWNSLGSYSGFPEPFLTARAATYARWSNSYARQLIREDIRDLTDVRSVTAMETLFHLLPSRVGNPLSVSGMARDLQVSPVSVRNWLDLFERFFLVFSIAPWTEKVARAILKERKVYLFDYPRIKDDGARFENRVALELWRAVTSWSDLGRGDFGLHFIRNKEKQEVDFLLTRNREPFLLVEAKLAEREPSAPLRKFQQALRVPALQLIEAGDRYRLISNGDQQIMVAPAWLWLAGLP